MVNITIFAEIDECRRQNTFHHLSCFAGGMISTGSLTERRGNWTMHLNVAAKLTETCYEWYRSSSLGLGGETAFVNDTLKPEQLTYGLRPEIVESIFYMWRYTLDPKYRECGCEIVKVTFTLNLESRKAM
jgi:mannosyl-oligosaccharide alpha-1,2-mannosidase